MRPVFQAVGARETSGDHGDYDYGQGSLAEILSGDLGIVGISDLRLPYKSPYRSEAWQLHIIN